MTIADRATAGGCGRFSFSATPRSSCWSSASAPGARSAASPARWSAPGALEVQGNRQVVQHPIGGVIKAIHARDGDR